MQGDRFCDVDFRQLVKEPCKVVKDIYAHFGYDFSPEFEQRIEAYMSKCDPAQSLFCFICGPNGLDIDGCVLFARSNPRYKHGKPQYSLEEFGLDEEELRQRFARSATAHTHLRPSLVLSLFVCVERLTATDDKWAHAFF